MEAEGEIINLNQIISYLKRLFKQPQPKNQGMIEVQRPKNKIFKKYS